jgi:hypothetical protein
VPGQQPVAAAVASDFGRQPGASFSAQQGFVQSGGQAVFGQQSGVPSTAQQGLVQSAEQVFATEAHSVFREHSTVAFSAKKAWDFWHVLGCESISEPLDKMFV